ncbi:MAG: FTR1 family protein [Gemmatimonadota bacterium]
MEFSTSAFLQSFGIIAREGLEVVLILGAMLAVLRKTGVREAEAGLWWGTGLALAASVLTALAVDRLFRSAEQVEVLEGVTMLVAAAVLFMVGHWLLSKADVARWKAYVSARVGAAAGRRSLLALGAVAFLAVFREGVETVLFYRALLAAESGSSASVVAGFLAGLAGLGLLCAAIFRLGVRIPLRPFFTATSALLLLLAFTFMGKGIHELQEGGVVSETPVAFLRLPLLGVYPTAETLVAQALMLVAIVVPGLYAVRARPASQRGPAPVSAREAAPGPTT